MKWELKQSGIGTGFFAVVAAGLLLGALLILLPVAFLMKIFFVVMGIVVLVSSVPGVLVGLRAMDTRAGKLTLVLSGLASLIGIALIFSHSQILLIVVGVYMIVFPIVELILARGGSVSWKAELPKIVVGCVLLLIGPARALELMFDIAGLVTIALTVAFAVISVIAVLRRRARAERVTGNRVFMDVDGDGSVDTVYVDTDGDGKHDTAKRYRK